jgi:antitoxin (DNA-binding transcriptional repressor) of toxin-antitoxin stability system
VLATKRGEPIAEVVPAARASPGQRSIGLLAGTVRIRGDVVAPAAEESDWEALKG